MAEEQGVLTTLGLPYSDDEVVLEINGQRIFKWISITFERVNPVNSWAAPGANGGHLAVHHTDLQGRLTLELMQNSPSLEFIKSLAAVRVPFPITIKDKSGTPDLATMDEALLENEVNLTRNAQGEATYRCQFIGVLKRVEGGIPKT